ncbi:Rha family transcriptional regulator [Gilliamella apicola]|uniref:Rha family transcriptional regulator n=1 Tax=Gilliamella apicola TaxID=1196095 RepID=UPI002FEE0970
MTITQFKFENMVTLQGSQVMTTSLKVAEYFNKRHDNILRGINKLECSKEFRALNFEEASYLDEQGKLRPMFKMTKDGFIFLVMGFTGKAAAQIKEAYINAFNWMAEKLTKMQHSYMKQHNDLMLEYMKEKDVASFSGRYLRNWRDRKPAYQSKIQRLREQSQIQLLI